MILPLPGLPFCRKKKLKTPLSRLPRRAKLGKPGP
ncbi:MAG: hypothetical protein LBQ61_04910 [Spirochaetales bacterium]|nr:hypothetical protein [Spirochaetales bacterium]